MSGSSSTSPQVLTTGYESPDELRNDAVHNASGEQYSAWLVESSRFVGVAFGGWRVVVDRTKVALPVHEHVTVQVVGKAEDDLAAIVQKSVRGDAGTERVLEQVAPVVTGPFGDGEVVALPVRPVVGFVPLDQAVRVRDAGAVEPRAGDVIIRDVAGHVDAEEAL